MHFETKLSFKSRVDASYNVVTSREKENWLKYCKSAFYRAECTCAFFQVQAMQPFLPAGLGDLYAELPIKIPGSALVLQTGACSCHGNLRGGFHGCGIPNPRAL